ncbi:MAG: hypothetical protein PHF19_05725 [Synergistales bacterium]|nr:hypothetical protein [Synergistales bacterium]
MKAKERIAYLKGLLEGLSPREEDEQKLLLALIDVADALASDLDEQGRGIEEQAEVIEEVADYCAQLEDDMTALEERMDGFSGEYGEEAEEISPPDDEQEFTSVTYPNCGLAFFCRPEALEPDEALECPGCGEFFEINEAED